MNRQPLEVADIIRRQRESFEQQSRGWISWHTARFSTPSCAVVRLHSELIALLSELKLR
jgi:hypothetical protein